MKHIFALAILAVLASTSCAQTPVKRTPTVSVDNRDPHVETKYLINERGQTVGDITRVKPPLWQTPTVTWEQYSAPKVTAGLTPLTTTPGGISLNEISSASRLKWLPSLQRSRKIK